MSNKIKVSKKILAYSMAVCLGEMCFSSALIPAKSRLVDEMRKDIQRLLKNNTIYTDGLLEVPDRAMQKLNSVLYKRVFKKSPWVKLFKRGAFPKGMGSSIRALTYEGLKPNE